MLGPDHVVIPAALLLRLMRFREETPTRVDLPAEVNDEPEAPVVIRPELRRWTPPPRNNDEESDGN